MRLPIGGTITNSVRLNALDNKWQQRKQEIAYLKVKNPKALKAYEEAKKEEKAYEKQLENCETKEEAEKLKQTKMGEFWAQVKEAADNPEIPKGEKLAQIEKVYAKAKRIEKVHEGFVQSSVYASLPAEEEKEEWEKHANSVKRSDDSSGYEKENDFFETDGFLMEQYLFENGKADGLKTTVFQNVEDTEKKYLFKNRMPGEALGTIQSIWIKEDNADKKTGI